MAPLPPLRKMSSSASIASYDRFRQPEDPLARVNTMNSEREEVDDEKAVAEAAMEGRNLDGEGDMVDDDAADEDFVEHDHSESDSGIEKEKAKAREGEEDGEEIETRHEVRRMQSYATDVSATTQATSHHPTQGEEAHKPWHKKLNPLRWGSVPPVPEEREASKEYEASFFSKMFFSWQGSLMRTGYKRPLEQNDIWKVNPDRSVYKLTAQVHAAFQRRHAKGQKYPLVKSLNEVFFREFWLGGACQFTGTLLQVFAPFVLRYLIAYATEAYNAAAEGLPQPNIGRGLGLVFGVTIMQTLQTLCVNHFIYRGMLVGGMARAVLISMIYEKSMVVSGRARAGGEALTDNPENANETSEKPKKKKFGKGEKKKKKTKGGPPGSKAGVMGDGIGWGNGRVVSLMSVDTYRVDQACGLFHMIWTAPIACIITLVLLVINLSYSALSGFALLVIGLPALTKAIKSLFRRRQHINKVTDQRVSLTQEILGAVRFVKYFGWESSFLNRLGELRSKEIGMIQKLMSIRNAIMAISLSLPIFASMLSFITYTLTDNGLQASTVFSSLALFNGLRVPLNLLPLVIGQVTDAWNSLKRIEEYMLLEEQSDEAVFDPDAKSAVELRHASFTWERTPTQDTDKVSAMAGGPGANNKGDDNKAKTDSSKEKKAAAAAAAASKPNEAEDNGSTLVEDREPFKLQDINVSIGRNELVAVIGTVGSGKTSLLAALAGDMRRTQGETILGASRAFCPQSAWIQNSTLKDNILFGKDMDRPWYKQVIKAYVPPPPPPNVLFSLLPFHSLCHDLCWLRPSRHISVPPCLILTG